MTRKKKIALIVTAAVVGTLLLLTLFVFLVFRLIGAAVDKYELDEKTQTYMEAIISVDNEKLHTVSYSDSVDAKELCDKLRDSEIVLQGEVKIHTPISLGIIAGEHGTTVNAVFRVTVGTDKYLVTVEYLENAEGTGIRSFYINPA